MMMSPAIKFTGNAPFMAEGPKDLPRDMGGAAFARFMHSPPEERAADLDQGDATAIVVADDLSGEVQVDDPVTDDEGEIIPLLLPDAAPDPLPMAVPHDLLPAAGDRRDLSDGGSDGGAFAGRLGSPAGQILELAVMNGPAQTRDLQGAPQDGRGAGTKPDHGNSLSGAGFDATGRLRVETIAIPAPQPVEAPDPDQAGEPSGLIAEIRMQVGVEAKGDVAAALSPAPKGAMHVAHNVVRQIGAQLADQQAGQIEVTLKPEELGTVRLVISAGDRPAIAVYAENSATLDLLRRHADLLTRELRDTGFAGADLSFADNSGAGQRQAADDHHGDSGRAGDRVIPRNEGQVAAVQPRPALGSLIDIRI